MTKEMVRVTTPGVWMLLTATLTLLAGLLVWSMLGTVTDTVETAAATMDGRLGLSGWTRELTLTAEGLSGAGPYPLSIVKEEKHPIDYLLGEKR